MSNNTTLGNKDLSGRVIAAAVAVHRELGPGFLESVYESALCLELNAQGINHERQKAIPIWYRETVVGEHRLDLVVENSLVVELKAAAGLEKIHFSTVRSYLKATCLQDGLLLNFAAMPLTIKRVGREWETSADSNNSQPPQIPSFS